MCKNDNSLYVEEQNNQESDRKANVKTSAYGQGTVNGDDQGGGKEGTQDTNVVSQQPAPAGGMLTQT